MSFVDESNNPKWFSATLGENEAILSLAKSARDAAALLSSNLAFVKKGAELAKTFLLLKANALSLILNAIATELENLHTDLSNAGFYAITITGQEEFAKKNAKLEIKVSKSFFENMEKRAKEVDKKAGNNKFTKQLSVVMEERTPFGLTSTTDMPINTLFDIDLDPFVSDHNKVALLSAADAVGAIDGIQASPPIKQQTPNQFLGKLMQKFQDKADPNTPTFSGSGQMAAIIMLVGVPDATNLPNLIDIFKAVGNFVGDSITGSFKVLGEAVGNMISGPFAMNEFQMTLYGVRGYKYDPITKKESNFGKTFAKGDFIKGMKSGIVMEVTRVESDDDFGNLGTKPTILKDTTSKFDYVVDQTLVLKQVMMGQSQEAFGRQYPGELVTLAEKSEKTIDEMDNNGTMLSYKVQDYPIINPRESSSPPAATTPSVIYARKNVPSDPVAIDPPAWERYTLTDTFEAYAAFLDHILVFATFLRSFATSVTDEIDKIIQFIDMLIEKAEEIVESIQALLAFFQALKDAGVYGLIIQDPSGSGLLKGGTQAMVSAIGNATGDESFPEYREDGTMHHSDVSKRIKPPETLRYTAGFCLVFGGPGAGDAYKVLAELISPP